MSTEARERLMGLVPHLTLARTMAELQEPTGEVHLGVLAKRPDGGGHVIVDWKMADFLTDLVAVLGFASVEELEATLDAEGEE